MSNLKDEIKNHYHSKQLSSEQLSRLTQKKRSFFILPAFTGAALSCLALVFFFFNQSFEIKVMEEIVYNHNKNLSVEVKSSDLKIIQVSLPKLDFLIASSTRFSNPKWEIVGARYCSIQGKIAAQIKLLDTSTGQVHTLYQAKPSKKFQLSNRKNYIDGTQVEIWEEKGLLMGIAGP